MMNKKIFKVVSVGVLFLVVFVALTAIIDRREAGPVVETNTPQTVEASITIDGLYVDKKMTVADGGTVLGLLEALDKENEQVQLKIKEYPGMGVLVESIGGQTNGEDDKYWQYKVNGVMPQVAADALIINNGDNVEWNFAASVY